MNVLKPGRLAFEFLKSFIGSYEVDQNDPGKPVVSIRVRYELDDEQLATLAKLLTAFPRLTSLQLKSPMITDAGLSHLKGLLQLHNLSLEEAAITDAGLTNLKALTALEELNLKGTRITDAGVAEFQKAVPTAKVQR